MARVTISSRAEVDMLGMWSHIADHSLAAADRMIDRFTAVFQELEHFPKLGEVQRHPSKTLRRISVRPYVIVYQVGADDVTIVRIFHSAQQWELLL